MDIEPNDPEFEAIARLIQEEEKAALEEFRRRDFRRRVKARIGEVAEKAQPRFFSWKLAIPAGAAALVLIAAGVVLFNRRPPVLDVGEEPGSFLAGLRGLPGLAELATGQGIPGSGGEEIVAPPRWIRDVLVQAQQDQAIKREKAVLRPGLLKVPRLSMERKMTILFKEKAIERVLILVRKKSEEV
jgi:hypothetical protein